MSPNQRAVVERNLGIGRRAEGVLEAIGGLHTEREQQLLAELLAWFNESPWDERVAVRYIAALNENRAQKTTLEYRAKKGAEARAKLFGNTTAD